MNKSSRTNHQQTSIANHSAKKDDQALYPAALSTSIIQRAQQAPDALSASEVMTLQRTIGNHAVARLLTAASSLQRAALPQVEQAGGTLDSAQESLIRTPKSGGQAVPNDVRSQVEQQTGADLEGVKVHNNQKSHILNRQLEARAFTHHNDIFLGKGESPHDVQLMAHELTHTIQQTGKQEMGSRQLQRKENGARPYITKSPSGIQRKLENIHIDKRFRRKYDKSINGSIQRIVQLLEKYNALPMDATNYDEQLKMLEKISSISTNTNHSIGTNAFMNKKWRKLGGPFRAAYYMLQRNLSFLSKVGNGGFAGREISYITKQKEDPTNQAKVRRIEAERIEAEQQSDKKNKKKGGANDKAETTKKYDYRELERGQEDEATRTFTAPPNSTEIPCYTPLGKILAGSIYPGSVVIATGVTVRVTINDGGPRGHSSNSALVNGRSMLMYEVRLKSMPKGMVPSTMWDQCFGANSYPRTRTPKNPKQFFNWLYHWEYLSPGQRDDKNYTEPVKRKLLKLNGFDISTHEGLDPQYLDIPDQLYHEGGLELIEEQNRQQKADKDELNFSHLEIPQELHNEGGFQLKTAPEDLHPSNLEIPQELQNENGFQLTNPGEDLDPTNLEIPNELQKEGGLTLL